MNGLIMCEGKSDAVLLGYYLSKTSKWRSVKKSSSRKFTFNNLEKNQYAHEFIRGNDVLSIFAVGGKDNFSNAFQNLVVPYLIHLPVRFDKIAIVSDRDAGKTDDIMLTHKSYFASLGIDLSENSWVESSFMDSFREEVTMQTLALILPADQQGALETVLLEAISEDEYDKIIVDKSKSFIDCVRHEADKYICTDRLKLKAYLSTVFAVMSPDKVFDFLDELLRNVKWEKSHILNECLFELTKI